MRWSVVALVALLALPGKTRAILYDVRMLNVSVAL
jgi:hypothetical protein